MGIRLQDDKVLFFAKMGVMLSNGVPLLTALENLIEEAYTDELKDAARVARERLEAIPEEERRSLPERAALGAFFGETGTFETEVIRLVRSGEQTGCLDLVARIVPEYILFGNLERWKGA